MMRSLRPFLAPRHGRMLAFLVVGVVFAAGGCAPQPGDRSGSGPGHRNQPLGLSPQKECELGQEAYQEILTKARQKNALYPANRPEVERVRKVGQRIVKAAQIEPLQREINLNLRDYKFEWEFNVLKSREINAFCLPCGKVAVFSELLRIVGNDDQLATVLSHEIAHALAHHSNERITVEKSGRASWLYRQAYDREQESEADHIGLFLMTFADYDPDEAVAFWLRMRQAQQGGQLPEILSNHPSDRRRIQQMRGWVPKAKAAKAAYDHHRIAAWR